VNIFGPNGNPTAKPDPKPYTLVPWERVQEDERKAAKAPLRSSVSLEKPLGSQLEFRDKNAVILDDTGDVFGEADELHMTNPRQTPDRPSVRSVMPDPVVQSSQGSEAIEMATRP
jgi:hypothetical protein